MDRKKTRNIISNISIILILIVAFFIYHKYDYNFYTKGILEAGKTSFSRDNKVKQSKERSYKIENKQPNDAMFYKEIVVKKNTPYKVTCMVKTEDVIPDENNALSGAQIYLNGTEEHSKVIQGTTDWTKLEFFFNSKCNEKVEIGFRLGGNMKRASGIVWFSDLKIEEGSPNIDKKWKFGCFLLDYSNLIINGKKINYKLTNNEKNLVRTNMNRLKKSIKEMSNNQMEIDYEIIEITEPLTSVSFENKNGYYIEEKDVYRLINSYVEEKEYDHIFVCTNLPLESELIENENIVEWIGLGNMLYLGKGFSNIRIIPKDCTYSNNNTFPEEVFLHEFLHTLERNAEEYGYSRPELHDYEKYNYEDDESDGQREWYKAYMNCKIKTEEGYIGLPPEIYTLKPVNSSNFIYSNEINRLGEPKNIKENIASMIFKIKQLYKNINIGKGELE